MKADSWTGAAPNFRALADAGALVVATACAVAAAGAVVVTLPGGQCARVEVAVRGVRPAGRARDLLPAVDRLARAWWPEAVGVAVTWQTPSGRHSWLEAEEVSPGDRDPPVASVAHETPSPSESLAWRARQ